MASLQAIFWLVLAVAVLIGIPATTDFKPSSASPRKHSAHNMQTNQKYDHKHDKRQNHEHHAQTESAAKLNAPREHHDQHKHKPMRHHNVGCVPIAHGAAKPTA